MRENSARIESRKKPRFVALTAANGLSAIPLYCERSAPSGVGNLSGTYAITLTNDNQFTIVCTNGPAQGHFELPTYRGATGNLKLALLTPVTLVLDASIVGGVAGYWCLAAAAASGNQCLYSTGL